MTNQDIIDNSIAHQIDMQFYGNGVVQEQVGNLNAGDAALFALLFAMLAALPPDASPPEVDRALLPIKDENGAIYATVEKSTNARLLEATQAELEFQEALFAEKEPKKSNAGLVFAAAAAIPFMGATTHESIAALSADRFSVIRRTVQDGFVAHRSDDEILRDLRGTKSANYEDGTLNSARPKLATIVRTGIAHVASHAAAAFRALNPNFIRSVIWLSVLDDRTSPPCIDRAGKRYSLPDYRPIGHSLEWGAGPGNFHYNCRSSSAPLLAGEIPKDNSYASWLEKQTAQKQDEILGPTRGKMFRAGEVKVGSFTNNKGRILTIDELRARMPAAPT